MSDKTTDSDKDGLPDSQELLGSIIVQLKRAGLSKTIRKQSIQCARAA